MTMTTPTSSTCAGQCTGYEESFKSLQKGRWSRSRTVTVQSNLSTSVVNTSKKALLKTARTKDGVHSGKVEEQQRHVGRGCFSWHCSKQRATLKETPTDQYVDIQERLLTSTSCYLLTYKRRTELWNKSPLTNFYCINVREYRRLCMEGSRCSSSLEREV